ncbi:MAG: low specificity L-threonine aldolase [Bacteroidales bacterium]|nr:low specificity L-threonine aldolase [Bacteroidales bacterium]
MIHFDCDYLHGAHPKIMERLAQATLEPHSGYGFDPYCEKAAALIREAVGNHFADIHFLVGGTQTNATLIGAVLHGAEAVLTAESGHINVHEAGAIEATGHKVITLPSKDGKLSADVIEKYLTDFYKDETWIHMSIPKLVYISFPTEYGTIYSLKELEAIAAVCKRYSLKLYVDGARLAYGLAAKGNDVTLKDLGRLCDAFYIGGTKVGTLFGEAVVLKSRSIIPNFFTYVKRMGALLAKGWLNGLQFETMFTDGLYMECGRLGVDWAMKLREVFKQAGYEPIVDSPTNQQFFTLPNTLINKLQKEATFEFWGPRGEESSTVRFVTSWATTEQDIEGLRALLK